MDHIYEIIKTSFNSLWKMRMRGDTLEVITPFATTNDKFVSIFISVRENGYVVNDGGWLANGIYDCDLPLLNDIYRPIGHFAGYDTSINTDIADVSTF